VDCNARIDGDANEREDATPLRAAADAAPSPSLDARLQSRDRA